MRSVLQHLVLLAVLLCMPLVGSADNDDDLDAAFDFEDSMLEEELLYPDWFKLSSGDLRDDLKEAVANGKQGIFVYFGQEII